MDIFNHIVTGLMPVVPKGMVGRVASRYIAGDQLSDAVKTAQELNAAGAMTTIDLLGEHCEREEDARQAMTVYLDILNAINKNSLDSSVSLKPTHFGLKISYDLCLELIEEVTAAATQMNNFVRLDMEDRTCTDDTLRLYFKLREKYDNVGIVIQAYLRRSIHDIEPLMEAQANVRLCKGIYNEPRSDAFKNRATIIRNYALLLEKLLTSGCYIGIATHCEETIWHAERLLQHYGIAPDRYEFQMLLGVQPELRTILMNAGHRLRVYIPFGEDWYAYSTRRLKENPEVAGFVARDFLGLSRDNSRR